MLLIVLTKVITSTIIATIITMIIMNGMISIPSSSSMYPLGQKHLQGAPFLIQIFLLLILSGRQTCPQPLLTHE